MKPGRLEESLENILKKYGASFASKGFGSESSEVDDLMLVFGLTQEQKAKNKQYWGRELGMCWERLVSLLIRETGSDSGGPVREGSDEICDFVSGGDAVDTKYRVGSGDSGTLKKFKQYGARLQELGYRPVMLVLRTDNLPAAITACKTGGWQVITGTSAYKYVHDATGFDLRSWLTARRNRYA